MTAAPEPHTLELLKLYRREIGHELELLAERMLWYVTCQSFLFAAIGTTLDASAHHGAKLGVLISVLAISISWNAAPSLRKQGVRLLAWRRKMSELLLTEHGRALLDLGYAIPSDRQYVASAKAQARASGAAEIDATSRDRLTIVYLFSVAWVLVLSFYAWRIWEAWPDVSAL